MIGTMTTEPRPGSSEKRKQVVIVDRVAFGGLAAAKRAMGAKSGKVEKARPHTAQRRLKEPADLKMLASLLAQE